MLKAASMGGDAAFIWSCREMSGYFLAVVVDFFVDFLLRAVVRFFVGPYFWLFSYVDLSKVNMSLCGTLFSKSIMAAGFIARPRYRVSKWRCGPVDLPVLPPNAIGSPAFTV